MEQKKGIVSSLVRGAIEHNNIVKLFLFLLIGGGILGLVNMKKDEFPTFEIKQGLIAAVYPGADVHQVEEEVGKPLEKLLFSMKEINRKGTRVVSKDGICYIYTDLTTPADKKNEVWSKIRLQLNTFKQTLPPGVLAIVVLDDFSDLTSVLIALESSDKGYMEMKEYADDLSDRLRTIPELANAKIIGTQSEEIAVNVDMDRLAAYGISPTSLLMEYQTAGLQALGGTFTTDYTSSPVHIQKTITDEQELADKIIWSSTDGQSLRLKDVATIERRIKDPTSLVTYNGNTAIVISIEMRPDNNIVAFGKEVDRVLAEFMADAPDSLKVSRITDQPKVVGDSVWSFLRDLVISMLVVIFVMLMLFPMRSALIASSGVPVCTAIAIALMYFCGICLNTVSLAALIVVLGMIVDDSIITMDGYMDHLSRGMSPLDAATASAQELFSPMFMATFAISAMFFPMTGIITGYLGDFVSTFPWVIAFSLMTSLAYAVLVVPSLEVRFIKTVPKESQGNIITKFQNVLFNALQKGYDFMQDKCFKHPALTIFSGVAAIALGLLMFSRMNIQLMPMAARPVFAVEVYLDPTAGLDKTTEVADSLANMLRRDSRITSVTEFIGTGTPRFHCTYSPILPGKNVAQLIVNDYTYHTGTIDRHEVTVMQCGIGKVNAAVGTLTLIDTFHPAIIINTGVAGGTGHGASIGDVVIASAVAYHDVWCGPGTVPGQAAGCPLYFESPLTPGTIERMGADLRRGVVASGDIFVSRPEEVRHILEVIPEAVAVDMESGAIAQVCHLKNIPFVCMRVISDTPGATHDNIAQYENFWEDAPRHTFDVLHRLLEVL